MNQVNSIVKKLRKAMGGRIKKMVLDITADLIEITPVDTGWARSNWIPSIGSPLNEPVGSPDSVDYGSQDSGIANVAVGYSIDDGPVYVSNNVHYIEDLNQGSSSQAPADFVKTTIDKAIKVAGEGIIQ